MASGTQIGAAQEDRQELEQFRSGSEAAFEALFRRHQRAVYGWILRIVRDPGTAEDLAIETFFRIHRAHARFDPSRGFEPWARRIATHAALDWMRAHKPESAIEAAFFAELPSPPAPDPAITGEIRRTVTLALGRLPPKLRVAALLALVEQRPHQEIASALGITTAAVKLRVFRATRRLRNDLQQQGITP